MTDIKQPLSPACLVSGVQSFDFAAMVIKHPLVAECILLVCRSPRTALSTA